MSRPVLSRPSMVRRSASLVQPRSSSDRELCRTPDIDTVTDVRQDVEAQATEYRYRLRSAIQNAALETGCAADDLEEDQEGIEEEDLEQLIAANESLQTESAEPAPVLMIPGRTPIVPPEWGDQLEARCIQEQLNVAADQSGVGGMGMDALNFTFEPPTGPRGHILIPATLEQFLAIHDEMKLSQQASHRESYPDPAFEIDIQQFNLTLGCPWLDRNLYRFATRIGLKRQVVQPVARGHHFLVAIMRPDIGTRWRQRRPNPSSASAALVQDTVDVWTTLDSDVPKRPRIHSQEARAQSESTPQTDVNNVLPCEVSSDVDSLIVLSDRLPLSVTLEVPSIISMCDTMVYSNKLCLPAGPSHTRTFLSRIPNFRLGRGGRLSVNMFFPDAFDPTFKGMGSAHIKSTVMNLLWDSIIQPAMLSVFPEGAYNSLPWSQGFEAERQGEIGGKSRRSWRSTSLPPDKLTGFVSAIRSRLDTCENESLHPYRNFKFLLSLQGFKSYSFTSFDDLTQMELPWFESLGLSSMELRPMMFMKGYLRGIHKITRDFFTPGWIDFNSLLQQTIARVRRQAAFESWDQEVVFREDRMPGDELDSLLHPHRRREGPSLQLAPDLSSICDQDDCNTCGVWVDLATELGCPGKVTVWNHSHCFDIVNSLIGRTNFVDASEWRTGVRIDEVATMPGLGGVGFTDKRVPGHGVNSVTPYVQLYCQEKVPTYAPFNSKARGAHDLCQIPARKLPLRYMLDCTGDDNSPLERWIRAEQRILGEPQNMFEAAFTARMEIRTPLHNALETTYNILIALSRTAKSDAVRHYEKDDWFRWKSLRAEYAARLPATIIGRRHSRPSDWTIIHVLLAAQTFVHGLHSRVSDITIERETANMHSHYLRVKAGCDGVTYEYSDPALSMKERAHGAQYLPFFPGGVRTLHQYFHVINGLDYALFGATMRGMSKAEDKWRLKVRRGLGSYESSGIDKLRGMIKYPKTSGIGGQPQVPRTSAHAIVQQSPGVSIRQDTEYAKLERLVNERIKDIAEGRLKLRSREAKELEVYLEREILDAPHIILRFGRPLGLAKQVDEALRLDQLRRLQETEGQCLELNARGRVQVRVEARSMGSHTPSHNSAFASRLDAGGLDVYNFQLNTPAHTPQTTFAIRTLLIEWKILHDIRDGLGLPGLSRHRLLCDTALPPVHTADDHADDSLYADWLRRAEDPSTPFPTALYESPSINDFVVFIFASFQQQLLTCLPKTVRRNKHFPEQEGLPYIQAGTGAMLCVSQNVMRDSYSELPARLTRFVATQLTEKKWSDLPEVFFPATLSACDNHPGWLEPEATYLDLWRGLLERVSELPTGHDITAVLCDASRAFIESHKLLPDLSGKVYKALKQKHPAGRPVSIWDDSATEKSNKTDPENFTPRWMTVNAGNRVASRIRLAYTLTFPEQKRYLGKWQGSIEIKEKKPNFAILYPSPPPFEYPWMKENYHRIISERGYMVWKENIPAERFQPEGKQVGIGHNWWDPNHDTVICSVCRTWTASNPIVLEEGASWMLNPNAYDMGGRVWGYYACRYMEYVCQG